MSRFVRPETVTLPLSDGDSIIVRRWLTEGESRDAHSLMYREGHDGKMIVNPAEIGISMVLAYLLDWSLCDDDGRQVIIRDQPVEVVRAALRQLHREDFEELYSAIIAHEIRETAARADEKKTLRGALASELISRSVA